MRLLTVTKERKSLLDLLLVGAQLTEPSDSTEPIDPRWLVARLFALPAFGRTEMEDTISLFQTRQRCGS
jgi:hypothetical protein